MGSQAAVPTCGADPDEVVFGVFASDAAHNVEEACSRAGIPAQRLTAALDARASDGLPSM